MSELMRSAITLGVGILLAAAAASSHAQTKPSNLVANAPAAAPGAKAANAVPAAAKSTPQTPAKSAKPVAKAPVAPAKQRAPKKPVETQAAAATPAAPSESEMKAARRDPFESLVARQQAAAGAKNNLPPGKAGLQVSTLRLDGIVKAPNGMIAVVSNPQARTYFLREGDHLYDGTVDKISMDGVSFHEEGKDAFGKPVERQVNKRIYSSPGEQQ